MAADPSTAAPTPLAPSPTVPRDSAEERIVRLFARFVSAGYLFYLALLAPLIVHQARAVAHWWTPFSILAVFVPPLLMGIVSFVRRTQWVRRAAALTALSFLVAAAAWPLAWNGTLLQEEWWIARIPGLAGLAAAITWRPKWTVIQLGVAVLTVQLINHYGREPNYRGPLMPDLAFAMGFCLLYVAAALMAMRTGRILDQTQASAYTAAASAAATQARTVQRSRFNALLHDWVMSTLLAAARQPHNNDVRRQAQLTLAKLDELGEADDPTYDTATLLSHLRTAVGAVDHGVPVETHVATSDAGTARYPAEAVRVIGEAVAEAVRNSVIHAGNDAQRRVTVTVGADRFHAVVADTGKGFDLDAVAPHRLGLAASILGRIRQLPGGTVSVQTRPGAGTTIRMAWAGQP